MTVNLTYDKAHGFLIHTSFRNGDDAWWGNAGPYFDRHPGLVSNRASAIHFADKAEAYETAHLLREGRRINEYTIEKYDPPPHRTDRQGSSGRA